MTSYQFDLFSCEEVVHVWAADEAEAGTPTCGMTQGSFAFAQLGSWKAQATMHVIVAGSP